jgi:hypothetical protein
VGTAIPLLVPQLPGQPPRELPVAGDWVKLKVVGMQLHEVRGLLGACAAVLMLGASFVCSGAPELAHATAIHPLSRRSHHAPASTPTAVTKPSGCRCSSVKPCPQGQLALVAGPCSRIMPSTCPDGVAQACGTRLAAGDTAFFAVPPLTHCPRHCSLPRATVRQALVSCWEGRSATFRLLVRLVG